MILELFSPLKKGEKTGESSMKFIVSWRFWYESARFLAEISENMRQFRPEPPIWIICFIAFSARNGEKYSENYYRRKIQLPTIASIETFYLPIFIIKYSKSMNCTFLDKDGKDQLAVMGCYGIGVGRTMASSIEQNHDENGIIWPMSIAPYEVVVLPLQMNNEDVVAAGEKIYGELQSIGADVALDDRSERAGFKFKDADLIGYPLQVVIGKKSLENGVVEVKTRKSGEKVEIPLAEVSQYVQKYIQEEKL